MELDFIRNYFVENKLNVSSLHNKPFQIINNNKNKKLTGNQDFLHSLYNSNLQIKWSNFNNIYKKPETKIPLSGPTETNISTVKPNSFYKRRTSTLQKNYLRFRFT